MSDIRTSKDQLRAALAEWDQWKPNGPGVHDTSITFAHVLSMRGKAVEQLIEAVRAVVRAEIEPPAEQPSVTEIIRQMKGRAAASDAGGTIEVLLSDLRSIVTGMQLATCAQCDEAHRLLSLKGVADGGLLDRIEMALESAQPPVPEWQPIETAPKDGSDLLLAKIVGHIDHPTAVWWMVKGSWSLKWNKWWDGIEPCGLSGPSHWMPIPRAIAPTKSRCGACSPTEFGGPLCACHTLTKESAP